MQNDDLSMLVNALEITGLDGVLRNTGSYTVLAPTNSAFESFFESTGVENLESIPVDLLTSTLLNHLIIGELRSEMLSTGYTNTQAISTASDTNMSLYVNSDNGVSGSLTVAV